MTLTNSIERIIILIAGIVIAFLSLRNCNLKKKITNQAISIENYADTAIILSKLSAKNKALKVDKQGMEITINKLKNKNEEYEKQIGRYKNISSLTTIRTETKIDTLEHRFTDTIPCQFERDIEIDSPNYNFSAFLNQRSFKINSLSIPNEQLIVVGDVKSGLFKPKAYEVTVSNSNPLVQTQGIQNQTIQPKMPVATIGVSVGYGFDLKSGGLSPNIGVSLQKPLIQF